MKHCLLSILNIHDLNFVNDKGIQGLTAGSSALDIRYQYDVRGQLLEECRNGAAVRYAYDAAGNRIQKTENKKETRYRYNQKNQLLQKEDADGISCFTYDRQGGIIEEKNAAGNRRFTYNSLHQQTQVETETGNIQKNRYDAEGLRYKLIENGKQTSFVYYNGELLHEKGEEAGLSQGETSYHLGAGIEAFQRDSKTFYYHQDEQLNTTLISDEKAAIRNHYQYNAFGAGLEAIEALPNRIRYTGQQYDQQTEQYYLRARYYKPVLGRFMQEDVYQGDGLNLYAYCVNNPMMYYDPSGYNSTNKKVCVTVEHGEAQGSKKQPLTFLTQEEKKKIQQLRNYKEVEVESYKDARRLLDNMPEIRPATYEGKMPNPGERMTDGFKDPRGTYRGDLINVHDPLGLVHPTVKNEKHKNFPHYNIRFQNGEKAAIVITGTDMAGKQWFNTTYEPNGKGFSN